MTQSILVPRPAATLILVRDADKKMQVFMVQRSHQAAFLPGGHVFPGGALDPSDSDPVFEERYSELNDDDASSILKVEKGGLAYWIAALRECFEEAGLLLAYDASGEMLGALTGSSLETARAELIEGKQSFVDLCRSLNIRLAVDRMVYFAHWITHVGAPRRFDARFFAAEAPAHQTASQDDAEIIGHLWITPGEALKRFQAGEMKLAIATIKTLEMMASIQSSKAFLQHVRQIETVPRQLLLITN